MSRQPGDPSMRARRRYLSRKTASGVKENPSSRATVGGPGPADYPISTAEQLGVATQHGEDFEYAECTVLAAAPGSGQCIRRNPTSTPPALFCSTVGTYADPSGVRQAFRRVCRETKLLTQEGRVRFSHHGLRHTFASLHLQAGSDGNSKWPLRVDGERVLALRSRTMADERRLGTYGAMTCCVGPARFWP